MKLDTSHWINQAEITSYLADIKKFDLLTRQEEFELIDKIKKGDDKAKDLLIKSNLRFVITVAKHYLHKGLLLQDLISEGNYGLVKAAERFDLDQTEVRFLSYAVWWIKQAIKQAINEHSRTIRLPVNVINDMLKIDKDPSITQEFSVIQSMLNIPKMETLDKHVGEDGSDFYDIIPDVDAVSPESALNIEQSNLKLSLMGIVDDLSETESVVIKNYFGLDGDEKTLQEIADQLSLTKERVRQIKEKAIKKLRDNSYKLFELM